eukprot:Sspe_Gene.4832::Locus_1596_Transcript_1_1_Confidence_1.000_Length_1528::g.4832::m.4832
MGGDAGKDGTSATAPLYVGEHVMMKGTGKWWSGLLCRAVIADVRTSDNTVKVQYNDGGYKRFTMDEFKQLRVPEGYGEEKLAFGTLNVEWADDVLSSVVGGVEEEAETTLREELKRAVLARDFLRADKLKMELHERQKSRDLIQLHKNRLLQAVREEDFKKAHAIQQEIEKLKKLQSPTALPKQDREEGFLDVLAKSARRALGGGVAGASAMVIQVTSLMWMRTIMNFQYRNGGTIPEVSRTLYREGGVRRFYRGLGPALAQGPLSRFGDTAANAGALALLDSYDSTKDLPVPAKTLVSSAAAATWRIFLTPLDTVKTILQVEGKHGLETLRHKTRTYGPTAMYHGALGASAATFAGHYPWFATYNTLDKKLPVPQDTFVKLGRNAMVGFCASVVSDSVSNSLRVMKTYRQTSPVPISYAEVAKEIVEKDGVAGLFGRGLQTRILANGMQGMMFSVLWKYFDSKINS